MPCQRISRQHNTNTGREPLYNRQKHNVKVFVTAAMIITGIIYWYKYQQPCRLFVLVFSHSLNRLTAQTQTGIKWRKKGMTCLKLVHNLSLRSILIILDDKKKKKNWASLLKITTRFDWYRNVTIYHRVLYIFNTNSHTNTLTTPLT